MNDKIGKDENMKFSKQNLLNWNGEYIADFSLENSLSCQNTKFQKKERKQWTYTNPNDSKSQLDYILIYTRIIK